MVNIETKLAIGAGLGILAAVLVIWQRGIGKTAADIGGAAVTAADGVIGGAVVTAGQLVGIPATDCQKCAAAMDEYDRATWYGQAAESFSVASNCPAADYFHWIANHQYRPNCK